MVLAVPIVSECTFSLANVPSSVLFSLAFPKLSFLRVKSFPGLADKLGNVGSLLRYHQSRKKVHSKFILNKRRKQRRETAKRKTHLLIFPLFQQIFLYQFVLFGRKDDEGGLETFGSIRGFLVLRAKLLALLSDGCSSCQQRKRTRLRSRS